MPFKLGSLVSILTPTFNHEAYIAQCIKSVLSQTYQNWEQIVLDDDSNDRTAEIVEQFDDKRIKFFRQRHKGIERLKETYNKALEEAKGEFVAILEGDDFYPPYKLERQLPAFKNEKVVLTWGRMCRVTDEDVVLDIKPADAKFKGIDKERFLNFMLKDCYIPAVTVMCQKSALEKIGGFQQAPHAHYVDYPTWLALVPVGEFVYIHDVLGYWSIHPDSVSHRFMDIARIDLDAIHAFENWPNELRSKSGFTMTELRKYWKRKRLKQQIAYGKTAFGQFHWIKTFHFLKKALGTLVEKEA